MESNKDCKIIQNFATKVLSICRQTMEEITSSMGSILPEIWENLCAQLCAEITQLEAEFRIDHTKTGLSRVAEENLCAIASTLPERFNASASEAIDEPLPP